MQYTKEQVLSERLERVFSEIVKDNHVELLTIDDVSDGHRNRLYGPLFAVYNTECTYPIGYIFYLVHTSTKTTFGISIDLDITEPKLVELILSRYKTLVTSINS